MALAGDDVTQPNESKAIARPVATLKGDTKDEANTGGRAAELEQFKIRLLEMGVEITSPPKFWRGQTYNDAKELSSLCGTLGDVKNVVHEESRRELLGSLGSHNRSALRQEHLAWN